VKVKVIAELPEFLMLKCETLWGVRIWATRMRDVERTRESQESTDASNTLDTSDPATADYQQMNRCRRIIS